MLHYKKVELNIGTVHGISVSRHSIHNVLRKLYTFCSFCTFIHIYKYYLVKSIKLQIWCFHFDEHQFFFFFKLLGGYVDRVTDWCVTGRGFTPRCVQL